MGFRFQKRIRIFKGLTLNLSKSGTSWTVGGPGASVNLKDGKATGTGASGTGLSYRDCATTTPLPTQWPIWAAPTRFAGCLWGFRSTLYEARPN